MSQFEELTKNFDLKGGIWCDKGSHDLDYLEARRELVFALEDRSFWFRHRNRVILSVVKRFRPQGLILDVGGGNGFVTSAMAQEFPEVALVEPGLQGCCHARDRGVQNIICSSIEEVAKSEVRVGGVAVLDVIEHIDQPEVFLRNCRRTLVESGHLFVTVPAFSWLWSSHDDLACHHRRYTHKSLKKELLEAGFRVDYMSYFFSYLVPPAFIIRSLPYLLGRRQKRLNRGREESLHGVSLGRLVRTLMLGLSDIELRWLRRTTLPIGTSIIAVASAS